VGRHLNIKTNLAAASLAALFITSASASLPVQAEARIPAAQTYPVISLDTPLARDAQTFDDDKALDAACRQTGEDKAVCLCVTHIMKYELTLSEYQAATRLYGRSNGRSKIRGMLEAEGFKRTEISMAEEMEQSLVGDKDFALRCTEAKAYYQENG